MNSKKLYVGGLPYSVSDRQLEELFSAHGTVESARVITDRMTGRSKGFGFVDMHLEGADSAIEAVGRPELIGQASMLVRPGGIIAVAGVIVAPVELPWALFLMRNLSLRAGLVNPQNHVGPLLSLIESGRLDPTAWLLFGLLYLWQLPHTLALAWMLRDEYRVAGLRMAGGDDPLGRRTAFRGVMAGVALLVASLALAPSGTPGWVYGGTALAIGLFLIAAMGAWMRCPSVRSARRAFLATLAYLPAVLFVLGLTSIFRSP